MREALLLGFLASCLRENVVACGDRICPAGTVCAGDRCATPEEAAVCELLEDGTPCATSTIMRGVCDQGVCASRTCFSDPFDDPVLQYRYDAVAADEDATLIGVSNGTLRVEWPSLAMGLEGIVTRASYDFLGGVVQVKVTPPMIEGYVETGIAVSVNSHTNFTLIKGAGVLAAYYRKNGQQTQIATMPIRYDYHHLWRIRHDATTNVVSFEAGLDETDLEAIATVDGSFTSVDAVKVLLYAGPFSPPPSPGVATFDDVEIVTERCPGE